MRGLAREGEKMSSPLTAVATARQECATRAPCEIDSKSGRHPAWRGAPALPAAAIWGALNLLALFICCTWLARSAPLRLTALEVYSSTLCVSLLNVSAWLFLQIGSSSDHDRLTHVRLRFWGALILSVNPLLVLANCSTSQGPFCVTCLAAVLAVAAGAYLKPSCATSAMARKGGSTAIPGRSTLDRRAYQDRPTNSMLLLWEREGRAAAESLSGIAKCSIARSVAAGSAGASPSRASALEHDAVHWMGRTVEADGTERLQGSTVADFASGQKQTIVHLAFCPPFAATPEFSCDSGTDSACRLKVAAVYPYGARIELKRTEAGDEPAKVQIRYAASVTNQR